MAALNMKVMINRFVTVFTADLKAILTKTANWIRQLCATFFDPIPLITCILTYVMPVNPVTLTIAIGRFTPLMLFKGSALLPD